MDDEPRLTQDWKNFVEGSIEDLKKAIDKQQATLDDYKSMKGWLLGLAAGVGGTVGFLAKEFSALLGRH